MRIADDFWKSHEASRRLVPDDDTMERYRGLELAPKTVESLVTWDVSGHARCEQERLSSIYKLRRTTRGGY